ncbi:hypothetical protein [Shewanella subflava]|uniref:HK97 gp10 family phage protein n=1 Tax=Shewanella subflava TaxID=2986476 RepID=A0ABT3I5W9_9GAMM|nr:hypothetical protein [Shewanella subflava]MCW3171430.1 hypothetical protein [Shewanella subflava]
MAIVATGFDAVTAELKRMRDAQAPAIAKAIDDAAKFGNQLAADEIFNKYGFKSKSYVEQHFSVSINPKTLTASISARMRASTLTRFASPRFKVGRRSARVAAGFSVNVIRQQPVWFSGAFTVIGRNGNQLMFSRKKGDNTWRSLKGQKALYGPSVASSFGYMRDALEPPIIAHLRKKYGRYAK